MNPGPQTDIPLIASNTAQRAVWIRVSFNALATSLLLDEEPTHEDVGLLLCAVVDGLLAGDRAILASAEEAITRLAGYGEVGAKAESLTEQLWTLRAVVILGSGWLEQEQDRAEFTSVS